MSLGRRRLLILVLLVFLVCILAIGGFINRNKSQDEKPAETLSQIEKEEAGGKEFAESQQRIQTTSPLLAKLPVELRYVSINYGRSLKYPNDYSKAAIFIRASDSTGWQQGLAYIRLQGYDPTDYEIIFVGFDNPFVEYAE